MFNLILCIFILLVVALMSWAIIITVKTLRMK